jgi:hypothetical protein
MHQPVSSARLGGRGVTLQRIRGYGTFLGFPTYAPWPFEDIGIGTTTVRLIGFLLVCAAELIAGRMLWPGSYRRSGRPGIGLSRVSTPTALSPSGEPCPESTEVVRTWLRL